MNKIVIFSIISATLLSLQCPIVFPLTGKVRKGYGIGKHICVNDKDKVVINFIIENNMEKIIEAKSLETEEIVFRGEYNKNKKNGVFIANTNLVYDSVTSFEWNIFEKINIAGFNEIADYYAYSTKAKITFKNDILDGEYQILNKDGKELYRTFISNGTGYIKEYYKNDILYREYNIKNNRISGLFKSYYNNGVLNGEYNYENGLKNGEYREYVSSGVLKKRGSYKDGDEEGTTYRYLRGEVTSEVNYKSGKFYGLQIKYYRNKNIHYKSDYVDNKLDGLTEVYYENGNLKYRANFKNGNLRGLYQIYDENNKIIYGKNIKSGKEKILVLDKNGDLLEKDISKDNIKQYLR